MKITTALKKFLVENGLAANATDEQAKAAASRLLITDALTQEKFLELTAEPEADLATKLEKGLDALAKLGEQNAAATAAATLPNMGKALAEGGEKGAAGTAVRVKRAHEWYSDKRSELRYPMQDSRGTKHPFAGQLVGEGEGPLKRVIQQSSQRDSAVCGAYVKASLQHCKGLPPQLRLTDHDKDLLQFALAELEWGGQSTALGEKFEGFNNRKLTELEQKAVLDDVTSGGVEAAPIVFDDMLITTPLLYGELFPSVNVVPIARGRRIEGVSIGNVTLTSGGADNTNITLFTTTSFIAAFDTNIYVCDGAIEIGLDFLSDSPIDIVGEVNRQYGIRQLAWLDEQVAVGDGTTEPEGVTVSGGTTSVAGGSAAPTVGVYESFFFGVTKKYKQGYPADRIMFCANETTYQRARAIAVGASDARRIFGMTHGDYMLMGHKYAIVEAMANTQAFFANMARYRMYRRLGITVRATTEGQTLVRKNLLMISARARWGGQLEDGGAAAYSSTMQA